MPKPPRNALLVSACLLGECCRYDAKCPAAPEALKTFFARCRQADIALIPVCPECAGGLPTPRPPAEIEPGKSAADVLDGMGRVRTATVDDVTAAYVTGAHAALKAALETRAETALLKAKSPSCGSAEVYDGTFTRRLKPGKGVTAELLTRNGVAVYSENALHTLSERLFSANVTIRRATPADYAAAENVLREAFWNCYAPGASEHLILHRMRASVGFVPKLDLVAETGGLIVASVAFQKGSIVCDDGHKVEVLSLGLVGVLPAYQKRGIASRLIREALTHAGNLGFRAVFLCGAPLFYRRLGFLPAETFGIRTAENTWFEPLQVFPLFPDALKGLTGRYVEDSVYAVTEAEALAYDQDFPPKKRVTGTPGQKRVEAFFKRQRPYVPDEKSRPEH